MFKFTENTRVDVLDKVPEQFRPLYEEVNDDAGKAFVLSKDAKVASAITVITGLTKALDDSRTEAKDYKTQLKSVDLAPLKEFGTDIPSIASTFKAKIDEFQSQLAGTSEAKLNLEKIKSDLSQAHSIELKTHQDRVSSLTQQLSEMLVRNSASEAITKYKGDTTLLMPFVAQRVKMVEEKTPEGKSVQRVYVVDEAGDRRYSGVTGQPMTIDELVVEMKGKDTFSRLFDAVERTGGGAQQSPGQQVRQVIQQNQNQGELTPLQKIAQGLSKKQYQSN